MEPGFVRNRRACLTVGFHRASIEVTKNRILEHPVSGSKHRHHVKRREKDTNPYIVTGIE